MDFDFLEMNLCVLYLCAERASLFVQPRLWAFNWRDYEKTRIGFLVSIYCAVFCAKRRVAGKDQDVSARDAARHDGAGIGYSANRNAVRNRTGLSCRDSSC